MSYPSLPFGDEMYRLNDIGLVAWLKYNGHQAEKCVWEDRSCWWFFVQDERLEATMSLWVNSTATVNVREYNRVYAFLKRELNTARKDGNDSKDDSRTASPAT